jgi:hypothetical protein
VQVLPGTGFTGLRGVASVWGAVVQLRAGLRGGGCAVAAALQAALKRDARHRLATSTSHRITQQGLFVPPRRSKYRIIAANLLPHRDAVQAR